MEAADRGNVLLLINRHGASRLVGREKRNLRQQPLSSAKITRTSDAAARNRELSDRRRIPMPSETLKPPLPTG
jgi:hypothetical protein